MKAVLIIDMLKDFIEEDAPLKVEGVKNIIDNINDVANTARNNDDLVIYICDRHRKEDSEFEIFPKHCVKGSEGSKIVERLNISSEDIFIYKRRFSAFFGTDLDLTLREYDIDELIVMGILTNICILYTVADAVQREYNVTVYSDCVISSDKDAHEFALNQMSEVLNADVRKYKK